MGDRVHARQTRQRQAVKVAATTRHSRTSQAQTFCLARGSVQLSGIALSSKTDGKDFQNILLVTTMYIVEKEALDLMKVVQ